MVMGSRRPSRLTSTRLRRASPISSSRFTTSRRQRPEYQRCSEPAPPSSRLYSGRIRGRGDVMWYGDLKPGSPWLALWYDYIRCGCGGIRKVEGTCPACGAMMIDHEPITIQLADGTKVPSPQNCYAGGEAGYQDYMYLEMIER